MHNPCPECDEPTQIGQSQCTECDYVFAFRGGLDITDAEWVGLIEELSDQERLYFTTNQLFIHWQRPRVTSLNIVRARVVFSAPLLVACGMTPLSVPLFITSALSLLVFLPWIGRALGALFTWSGTRSIFRLLMVIAFISTLWWTWSLALIPPLLLLLLSALDLARMRPHVTKQMFMIQLQRWQRYHSIPMLLIDPNLQRPKPELQGEALYDYEVRELLIVDQDLTVDLLTYNQFLNDQHLMLISTNGYPEYSATFARRLLTLHDDVTVYLMHRDGHDIQDIRQKLRGLGVRTHRVVYLGWGARARAQLTAHLGFIPCEWDAFAVDSLPPESLLEGLPIAIEDECSLIETLGPRLRIIT